MLSLSILSSHCQGRFGNNVFMNLIQKEQESYIELTVLQQLHHIKQSSPAITKMMCTPTLQAYAQRLWSVPIHPFPDDFESSILAIESTPTLFIADAPHHSEIVSGVFASHTNQYEITAIDRLHSCDAIIRTHADMYDAPHVFDLTTSLFSQEQQWLMALMGSGHLTHSSIFKTNTVGITHHSGLALFQSVKS